MIMWMQLTYKCMYNFLQTHILSIKNENCIHVLNLNRKNLYLNLWCNATIVIELNETIYVLDEKV